MWIETLDEYELQVKDGVTPLVGVWIETPDGQIINFKNRVTPLVGVWIETNNLKTNVAIINSHTSRRCVD